MKFYHIKDDYISFLREFDKKVSENKQESRPYVGTLIQMGDVGYYAPFTSPKKKHLQMKNGKDFRKIVLTENDQLTAYDRRVKERCCNLKLLESIYIQYNKNNMV